MRTLRFNGILFVTAVATPLGCGEPFTSGTPDGSASTSSSTSTSSTSGTGGDGGAGGAGGAGTTGGAGGAGGSTSSSGGGGLGGCDACGEGEFCTASQTCVACSDLSGVVTFGPPEEIPVVGTDLSFPRVSVEDGTDGANLRLVYVARFGSDDTGLGTALGTTSGPNLQWEEGGAIGNRVINTEQPESGPFFLPDDASSSSQAFPPGTLFFDRGSATSPGARRIFTVGALGAINAAEEVEALSVGEESYSVAVARAGSELRYWFMTKRQENGSSVTQLVTKLATDTEVTPLSIKLPGNCEAKGEDLAPWVTPDGKYLFFQAPYSAIGECGVAKVLRSFFVKLGADGLPEPDRLAVLLLPTTSPTSALTTPSLSPDGCKLFFASNKDGVPKLYTSRRL